jgi:hypothetical protein
MDLVDTIKQSEVGVYVEVKDSSFRNVLHWIEVIIWSYFTYGAFLVDDSFWNQDRVQAIIEAHRKNHSLSIDAKKDSMEIQAGLSELQWALNAMEGIPDICMFKQNRLVSLNQLVDLYENKGLPVCLNVEDSRYIDVVIPLAVYTIKFHRVTKDMTWGDGLAMETLLINILLATTEQSVDIRLSASLRTLLSEFMAYKLAAINMIGVRRPEDNTRQTLQAHPPSSKPKKLLPIKPATKLPQTDERFDVLSPQTPTSALRGGSRGGESTMLTPLSTPRSRVENQRTTTPKKSGDAGATARPDSAKPGRDE